MAYHTSVVEQAVLTDFINEGHFGRHIRRMRIHYAKRQSVMVSAIEEYLGAMAEAKSADAGMHIIAWLKGNLKGEAVAVEALKHGVYAPPLSFYCMNVHPPEGLLLGYTGISNTEIRRGIRKLADLLRHL